MVTKNNSLFGHFTGEQNNDDTNSTVYDLCMPTLKAALQLTRQTEFLQFSVCWQFAPVASVLTERRHWYRRCSETCVSCPNSDIHGLKIPTTCSNVKDHILSLSDYKQYQQHRKKQLWRSLYTVIPNNFTQLRYSTWGGCKTEAEQRCADGSASAHLWSTMLKLLVLFCLSAV